MTQLELLMSKLDISKEEAESIIATDKEIDKGANPFPLSPEQEQAAKAARRADRKPTVYNFQQRERKVDADKHELISLLDDAVCDIADRVEERTNDREIIFYYNDRKFKLTLSAPRS